MKKYTFCKKNGEIKKRYIFACKCIVDAKIEKHEIVVGRHDDKIDEYECYSIRCKHIRNIREKGVLLVKIKEICENFDVEIKDWLYPDFSIDFHGDNVANMISSISYLLEVNDNA